MRGIWPWAYGWCWVYICDCKWIDDKSTIFATVNRSLSRILQLEVCPVWQSINIQQQHVIFHVDLQRYFV